MQAAKIPVEQHEFEEGKLLNVQAFLVKHLAFEETKVESFLNKICWLNFFFFFFFKLQEKMMSENTALSLSAKEAYKTYISGYDSHSMKDVFNVHRLDLKVTTICHL